MQGLAGISKMQKDNFNATHASSSDIHSAYDLQYRRRVHHKVVQAVEKRNHQNPSHSCSNISVSDHQQKPTQTGNMPQSLPDMTGTGTYTRTYKR